MTKLELLGAEQTRHAAAQEHLDVQEWWWLLGALAAYGAGRNLGVALHRFGDCHALAGRQAIHVLGGEKANERHDVVRAILLHSEMSHHIQHALTQVVGIALRGAIRLASDGRGERRY